MNYDIQICDEIGLGECSYLEVKNKLTELKGKKVKCRISSPGGYASDGFKIMQAFREHGDVTVFLDGVVASAATVISMGAKRVIISPYTQYLIHQSSTAVVEWTMMNQDEIRDHIENLQRQLSFNETMDHMAATLYADRSGKTIEEMSELMHKAIWKTPDEVIELGLADELGEKVGQKMKVDAAMNARLQAMNLPPLPNVKDDTEDNVMVDNIVTKVVAKLAAIFNPNPIVPIIKEPTTTIMNKNFQAVMALLALEAITFADGKAEVTEEQMKSINDALSSMKGTQDELAKANASVNEKVEKINAMQSEIDKLKSQLTEKDNEIAALKSAPGAGTSNVLVQHKDDPNAELSDEEASAFATALANRFRS